MKSIINIILILSLYSLLVFSQSEKVKFNSHVPQFNYSDLPNNTPNSLQSVIETQNGFDNFRLGTDFAEPMIATNPRDPLNSICAFVFNRFYFTLDGLNWTNIIVSPYTNADPFLCYDSLGNAFYISGVNGISVFKSTNKGMNWQVYPVYSGLLDKPSISAVQSGGPFSNYLYLTWMWDHVYISRSTNNGVNWSAPVTVSSGEGYCSWLAVGANGSIPGGNLYCAYNDWYLSNGDSNRVIITRSTDGGATFLNEITASRFLCPGTSSCNNYFMIKNCTVQSNFYLQMAADNGYGANRGNVYIVYSARTPGPDLSDIFFIRSTDYGTTWSVQRKINDDNTNTDQWLPAIAVDNLSGKIFITWYDSRNDPGNNTLCRLYGTVSTDGGITFSANTPVSTVSFNPGTIVQNFGWPGYMGHYNGISAIGNTSYVSWVDGRANNMGSYTAYYPDFAVTVNPEAVNLGSNDSVNVVLKIPAVNGPFTDRIKFTAVLDTLPASGNIFFSFTGKDSVTNIPDSVVMKIRTQGVTIPRLHRIIAKAFGTAKGVPVHNRLINVLVNSSFLNIGTNRNSEAQFKVNNILYNSFQQLPFANGSVLTVQALNPYIVNSNKKYIFVNWSDAGDTTHNITINSNINLTAFYKTQFKFILVSSVGNEFGGTNFYDSLQQHTFGVLSRIFSYNGQNYRFRGWTGSGNNSYTSPDSTGIDTVVNVTLSNSIVEIARWEPLIGIVNIKNEIPVKFELYQNYPNPFNPNTVFRFDIPKESYTKLTLYNILGQEVEILLNKKLVPGKYEILWDGSAYSSGIYFYLFESGDYKAVKKMIFLK